jgi:protein phosphatase
MIELALRGGGPDNITCIVADVVDIDFGEDRPIVGGSVGDGSDDPPPPDSAAARASATTMTRTAPQRVVPPVTAPAPRRSRLRVALIALGVLAVLVVGTVLARAWVMQQYYVGADDDQVVIFKGVRGSVLGLTLHEVAERPGFPLEDLPEPSRNQVREGITANDGLQSARVLIDRLRERRMPPCATTGQPAPSADPAVPSGTSVAPTSAAPPAGPPQPGQPGVVAQPPEQPTPLQTPEAVPGLTCRRAG